MVGSPSVDMKDSYRHALFDKFRKRMKSQKAIVAVAGRLLKVGVLRFRFFCRYSGAYVLKMAV